jgi:Putative Ig domain
MSVALMARCLTALARLIVPLVALAEGAVAAAARSLSLSGGRRRRRHALVIVAPAVVSFLVMSGGGRAWAGGATPIGSYDVVVSCSCGTFTHTLNISSYDPNTGQISGTNTNPQGLVSGTVNENATPATISMQWSYQDGSGYVADLTGTIDSSGNMFGSGSDNLGQTWTWTATQSTTILPYQGTGYRYLQVPSGQEPPGWQGTSFDDSNWATGDAAFGSGGGCPLQPTDKTHWEGNTDMLLRKPISLPVGTSGVTVGVAVDNDVEVYWNGMLVGSASHENCPAYNDFAFPVPDRLLVSGSNLLAVRGIDRGDQTFLDVTVTGNGGAAQPLAITTPPFAPATEGVLYSQDLTATGGTPPYSWSVSGHLPTGLKPVGASIAGTPTAGGTSDFTLMVRDSSGQTAQAFSSITVGWNLRQVLSSAGSVGCCETNQSTGPVIKNPHVAIVLVGDWWCNLAPRGSACQQRSNDLRGDVSETRNFVDTIGSLFQQDYSSSSGYDAPLANYYQVDCSLFGGCQRTPVGYGVTPDRYAPYGGKTWAGPVSLTVNSSSADVRRALQRVQAGFGILPSDLNHTVFVLLYAPDLLPGAITNSQPSASLSCNNPSTNSPINTFFARFNVANVYLEDALWNCLQDVHLGVGSVITYPEFATYTTSHEFDEDVTDPLGPVPTGGGAWSVDAPPLGWQVADVCEFRNQYGETSPTDDTGRVANGLEAGGFVARNYTRDSFGTVVAPYVTATHPSSCNFPPN